MIHAVAQQSRKPLLYEAGQSDFALYSSTGTTLSASDRATALYTVYPAPTRRTRLAMVVSHPAHLVRAAIQLAPLGVIASRPLMLSNNLRRM